MCLVVSLRKELHKFNDTMQKHFRALKSMGHEIPGHFLTSGGEIRRKHYI